MNKIYLTAMALMTTIGASSQTSITEAENVLTQDFNSLGTSAAAALPANWRVQNNPLTPETFGTYASAGTVTTQVGGNNMSATASNGIYNFGAGDPATATDRALGGLSSSSNSKNVTIYHHMKNDGADAIANFTISYDVEKYRNGSNTNGFSIKFYYSFDGTSWQQAPASFTTVFAPASDNSGFAPAPSVTTNITNQSLNVSLPAQSEMYLAWNYSVSSGVITSNAIALGLDNVTIKANYADVLPVKLTNFRLVQKGNAVGIDWAATNEVDMNSYEIEKSNNGRSFNVLGKVNAINSVNSKYNYIDATPVNGYNYYRLRSINKTGEFTYSQVLRINMGAYKSDVSVISNPVYDKNVNLQFTNVDKGRYSIRVFTTAGQQVYARSLDYTGGSSTESFSLPAYVNRGIYFLQVSSGNTRINKQIVIN